jgi:hypothetical protein
MRRSPNEDAAPSTPWRMGTSLPLALKAGVPGEYTSRTERRKPTPKPAGAGPARPGSPRCGCDDGLAVATVPGLCG